MDKRTRTLTSASGVLLAFGVTSGLPSATAVPVANAPMGTTFVAGPWVSTGIHVNAGDDLSFTGNGRALTWIPYVWNGGAKSGPDGQTWGADCADNLGVDPVAVCAMQDQPFGALVGRIGTQTFLVGASRSITSRTSGDVELAVNDYLAYYEDNSGGYSVQIR